MRPIEKRYPLSDVQLKELNALGITDLAYAWLDFKHSTPFPTENDIRNLDRKYYYFKAPKTLDMNESDLIWGKNRDKAYKELKEKFRETARKKLLDKIFDDHHKIYWHPKTMPETNISTSPKELYP